MEGPTLSFEQYLDSLPPDRRTTVERVWQVVRANMPAGYLEQIDARMLTFKADGEWYVALANQKNYASLYLMPVYCFPELKARLDGSGKKLRMGKSCINFTRAEDLPLDVIGEILAAHDAEAYKEQVRRIRSEAKDKRRKERKR
jgi:uncharacterized protein YdhG (YjbR/CyaY superfamily)